MSADHPTTHATTVNDYLSAIAGDRVQAPADAPTELAIAYEAAVRALALSATMRHEAGWLWWDRKVEMIKLPDWSARAAALEEAVALAKSLFAAVRTRLGQGTGSGRCAYRDAIGEAEKVDTTCQMILSERGGLHFFDEDESYELGDLLYEMEQQLFKAVERDRSPLPPTQGPIPPDRFVWRGVEVGLTAHQYKLVTALFENGRPLPGVPVPNIVAKLYPGKEHDVDANPEEALRMLVYRANAKLHQAGVRLQIELANGHYHFIELPGQTK